MQKARKHKTKTAAAAKKRQPRPPAKLAELDRKLDQALKGLARIERLIGGDPLVDEKTERASRSLKKLLAQNPGVVM